MKTLFSRYATPFTVGLFFISLGSGIALFFHFGNGVVNGMHEWLSMVLIPPFILHLWKNGRPFVNYFGRFPMTLALGLSLAAAIAFLIPAATGNASGGPPQMALVNKVMANSIGNVAPALGMTADQLKTKITAAGYKIDTADESLKDIATKSGHDPFELMIAISASAKAQ